MEKVIANPNPSAMIETFRSIGYSVESAVADIIDNSITANAKNIYIDVRLIGKDITVSIRDDGTGMDNNELINAMKPGSHNPSDIRDIYDLGRFGLGLKTASFSQCSKFTVITKKNDEVNYWTWDISHVKKEKKWELIKNEKVHDYISILNNQDSGTIVIWHQLDRIIDLKNENKDNFEMILAGILRIVEEHIALIYHRFIENNFLSIYLNSNKINAWNPFLPGLKSVQVRPDEYLFNGLIKMKGYILPHKSKMSNTDFSKAGRDDSWNKYQGFYIYRNNRILVFGDWLGLYNKEEHYKLARISIDIDNSMDSEWQIDIKKAVAVPPTYLKKQIKSYANDVRKQAVEIFRQRGAVLKRNYPNVNFEPVWLSKQKSGKRYYKINREHPLLKEFIIDKNINEILKFVEETIPVQNITINENENPDSSKKPFDSVPKEIEFHMRKMYNSMKHQNIEFDEIKARIIAIEPFNNYPEFLEYIGEENE